MFRILILILALFATPALAQFPGPSQGTNTGLWNDQSAVSPDVGGVNLTSHASRFNHLMVGEASLANASFNPAAPMSWMDSYIPNFVPGSQIAVTSIIGGGAIGAASRTSDERTALGTPSGGSAGGYFFGINDDPGGGGPIGLGSNSVGVAVAGISGVTLGAQQDIDSAVASACVPTPQQSFCFGATTVGTLITAGAFASLATQDATEGLLISSGATAKFLAGIVIDATAIRAAAGPVILGGASTVGIALPVVTYIIWYNAGSPSSAVWGGSAGSLNFFVTNTIAINGTAAVSCGPGLPTAGFTVIHGIVTAC